MRLRKLGGAAIGATVLAALAGFVLALPTGSLSIVPGGSVLGGAGPLKPSLDFSEVTKARVDDGAVLPALPGAVTIGFSNKDTAFAEDTCEMKGTATQPDAGHGIRWSIVMNGRCRVNGFTVNAPGDPEQGSYLTENEALVWARLSTDIQGQPPLGRRGRAHVKIENESDGNLNNRGRVEMGTLAVPILVTGDPNENFEVTLAYGGNARVTLEALRPEVEVGGLAFAGEFKGSISAWQVAPGGQATLLKQANGLDDAVWDIK